MGGRLRFGAETAFGAALALLGAVAMWSSFKAGIGSLAEPDAGLFPFFAGLTVFVGAILVTTATVLRPVAFAAADAEPGGALKLTFLAGIFAGWILILPLAGFVIGTFLAVLAFAKVMGLDGWTKPLALSAATALGIYVLFDRLMFLDLPAGWLFG